MVSNKKVNRTEIAIVYSISELLPLKPIAEITQAEADDIFEKMVAQMKYWRENQTKIEEYMNWEKINDFVIAKGYSPIGAGEELGKKSDKF